MRFHTRNTRENSPATVALAMSPTVTGSVVSSTFCRSSPTGAVPGHIHPTDEGSVRTGTHPSEAVRFDLPEPVPLTDVTGKALCVQPLDFEAAERPSPGVVHRRRTLLGLCLQPGTCQTLLAECRT